MKSIFLLILIPVFSFSQIKVNKKSVSESDFIDVWLVAKPFNSKESIFIDYGQDKFRPHYYDHKTQSVHDNEGNKFKKGEYLRLHKYLKSLGWSKESERETEVGEQKGRIITYVKE